MRQELIEKVFDNLIEVKCSKEYMKERLSGYSQSEKSELLKEYLNPSEYDFYQYTLEKYERYSTLENDPLFPNLENLKGALSDVLFDYEKRIITHRTNKSSREPPLIDINKFQEDKQNNYGGNKIQDLEQHQMNIQKDVTDDEWASLRAYFDDSTGINSYLWHLKGEVKEYTDMINDIDTVIKGSKGLSQDTVLYHKGSFPVSKNIGDAFTFKGYMSTTFQKGWLGKGTTDGYIYKILAPKGTKGVCANDNMLSSFNENEYLLGRNTKIRILDVNVKNHEVLCIIE